MKNVNYLYLNFKTFHFFINKKSPEINIEIDPNTFKKSTLDNPVKKKIS